MFPRWLYRIFLIMFLAGTVFASSAKPVYAIANMRTGHRTSLLTIDPISGLILGEPFAITGSIKDSSGKPIVDSHIFFAIDGTEIGQAKADTTGRYLLKVSKKLIAGKYDLTASFKGSRSFTAAHASETFEIKPVDVVVQTIPAISGIPFKMDNLTKSTDTNGQVRFTFSRSGTYKLEALVDQYSDPSTRIEFGRWSMEDYDTSRDVQVPTKEVIEVGINVYHQVSQKFFDLANLSVLPNRISEYTIKSSQGDVFTFKDDLPHWIPASRIARRITGLEETKLLYSMINVLVDGSNVVNQSQQRYYAGPNDTWKTSLLLYSMKIRARDGLFSSPVGTLVNLKFPDGRIEAYPLNPAGEVEIHSLARGLYTFRLGGVTGLVNTIPVALSRDQVVNIKVITLLDMIVVALLGLLVVAGLLFYGRPWLLKTVVRKSKKLVLYPSKASVREN